MKELLKNLALALVTFILTRLVAGEPLAGLTRLKGLSETFLKASVPAWAFAATLFVALWASIKAGTYLSRRRKGRVHFVSDAHNTGWSRSDTRLDLRLGGTFTYEGTGTLNVLKAFPKGTQLLSDIMGQVAPLGSLQPPTIAIHNLELSAHRPIRAILYIMLTHAHGTLGKPLRLRLVFRDTYNRDYALDPIDFPYLGQPVSEGDKR
jgi:hypothetical protein